MRPSTAVCYTLWLFFGWFGAHHLYLGRYRHAFIWLCTLGGFCGVGWFRDLWRLPDYIAQADTEVYFTEEFPKLQLLQKKAKFSVARFSGEMAVGMLFGILAGAAIPETLIKEYPYLHVLGLFGISIGKCIVHY